MTKSATTLSISTPNFKLKASIVPWDSKLFGFTVAQIELLEAPGFTRFRSETSELFEWVTTTSVHLLTCRLQTDRLCESFFLEQCGFHFIETVLHPVVKNLQDRSDLAFDGLSVRTAKPHELAQLKSAARGCFKNERFHVDPRLDDACANERYAWFVEKAIRSESQQLLVVTEGDLVVAFFIAAAGEGRCHWYLTAVMPQFQQAGYGFRAWRAVMHYFQIEGVSEITTTISARNSAVLGLYAKLNFRFNAPEMTFHWFSK